MRYFTAGLIIIESFIIDVAVSDRTQGIYAIVFLHLENTAGGDRIASKVVCVGSLSIAGWTQMVQSRQRSSEQFQINIV